MDLDDGIFIWLTNDEIVNLLKDRRLTIERMERHRIKLQVDNDALRKRNAYLKNENNAATEAAAAAAALVPSLPFPDWEKEIMEALHYNSSRALVVKIHSFREDEGGRGKIPAIKWVRSQYTMDLREAKEFAERFW